VVDSFSTKDNKYSFKIDNKPYVLPSLTFGDLDSISGFGNLPDDDKIPFVQKLITDRADKRTIDAVNTLSVGQVAQLFKNWAGLTPGEPEASPKQ
jgi:hypothetical protein